MKVKYFLVPDGSGLFTSNGMEPRKGEIIRKGKGLYPTITIKWRGMDRVHNGRTVKLPDSYHTFYILEKRENGVYLVEEALPVHTPEGG